MPKTAKVDPATNATLVARAKLRVSLLPLLNAIHTLANVEVDYEGLDAIVGGVELLRARTAVMKECSAWLEADTKRTKELSRG